MSGSIGGDRIPHSAVQNTIDRYREILKAYPAFRSLVPTGSTTDASRKDHGDVDLGVYLEGTDIKDAKKKFIEFLNSLPDDITVPFRAGRNKGKKAIMYADIVTCQIPIVGFEGLLVQIDNAIVLSEQEQTYKKNFLDLPGEKQALLMGLARTILLEESPETVLKSKRLGIKKTPELGPDQELEFVLSPTGLTLRKVTLENFKEKAREDVWKSTDWSFVEKLFRGYDLSKDFDSLLADIKAKGLGAISRRRITGIVGSTLVVGPGEVGKPKGDNKERARNAVSAALDEADEPEEGAQKIALYGGGFKPPHRAHFEDALKVSKGCDRLIVIIGSKLREGVPITPEQSQKVWNIYKKYISVPTEIRVSTGSPIGDIYKLIENPELSDTQFVIAKGQGVEEDKKFAYLVKNQSKYPNVSLKTLPTVSDHLDQKFSASTLRQSIETLKKGDWMPPCLDRDDARKVLEILINPLQQQALQEEMKATMKSTLTKTLGLKEASSGTPISPAAAISSENREKLSNLYKDINSQIGQDFNVKFNISSITITPRYDGDTVSGQYDPEKPFGSMNEEQNEDGVRKDKEFNYVPYIASYCKFLKEQGIKIEPLPEIVLNKAPQTGGLLDKTGEYDPERNRITLYTAGRHPRDLMRSCAHELYHKYQDNQGLIKKVDTQKVSNSGVLEELEADCYRNGNILYRKWLEKIGGYDNIQEGGFTKGLATVLLGGA